MTARTLVGPGLAALALAALTACGGDGGITSDPVASADHPTSVLGQVTDPVDAVWRVQVTECGGLKQQRATGVAMAPDTVMTVAHTFVDAESFELRRDDAIVQATIVGFDLGTDVAVLHVESEPLGWLGFGDVADGAAARVITAADDDIAVKAATVLRHVDATLDGDGRRSAIEIDADIDVGDSGAPLVTDDDTVAGIVFATSRQEATGWVIAESELRAALARPPRTVALDCGEPGP